MGVTYGNGTFVAVGYAGAVLNSADGAIWTTRRLLSANNITGIVYAQGIFVAVGDKIETSTDGITWTSRTEQNDHGRLRGIAYGNGKFVAVGDGEANVTSTDGITWVTHVFGSTALADSAVTFGAGKFVVVDLNGAIKSSTDGVTWTPGALSRISSITFGAGLFIAVGGGSVYTSTDGITWISKNSGISGNLSKVGYGGGVFVALGPEGSAISTDGVNWVSHTATMSVSRGVTYANGIFASVGEGGSIYTSADGGLTWTNRRLGFENNFRGVVYGNGLFVAVGKSNDNEIAISSDGISWRLVPTMVFGNPQLQSITYGGGVYVAVGENGVVITSEDGQTWFSRSSGTTNTLYGIAYGGGKFLAVGSSGTIVTSPDGIVWTTRSSGATEPLTCVTFGDAGFVAVGGGGTEIDQWGLDKDPYHAGIILNSRDGVAWTGAVSGTIPWLGGVTYGNGMYVAVGNDAFIASSPDGLTWDERGQRIKGWWKHSVTYGNGVFIAGGAYAHEVTISLDGVNWVGRSAGATRGIMDVTYGNGTFIAVSGNGTILQSGVMNSREIIATGDPNGTISPAGSVRVSNGENQTFTITPNAGGRIVDVLVDGISQGPITTYTFANVIADHTISASFTGGRQLTGITVTGAVSMQIGTSQTLALTGRYSDSSTETIPNANAAWTSLNTQIATVGTTGGTAGVVQAAAQGKTTITASYRNIVGSLEITVGAPPPPLVKQHHGNLILVAGGGVKSSNTLKEATLYLADLVYSRFKSRLFSDEDIYYYRYYRPISWVDLDGDGNDDKIVDVNLEQEEFSVADFGQRITQWAANQSSDGPLYIYLIDHGGIGSFLLYPNQILTLEQLKNYLNVFQERTGRQAIVIIEACKSGSFTKDLATPNQDRIVVTSADEQDSYMQLGGRISFTQFFIDRLLEGNSIQKGYQDAKNQLVSMGLPYSRMQPQMVEGKALAAGRVILGGDFAIAALFPEMAEQSPNATIRTGTSQNLYVKLSSLERLEAVWAVVTPPDYVAPSTTGDMEAPLVNLPTIKLDDPDKDGKFEGSYSDFTKNGEYRITFYARNGTGNVSASPATLITVTSGQITTNNLTVTKSGTGSGTVASTPAGITCGSDCTETYGTAVSVTLTATADSGSTFTGWAGGGCSGTAPCTVIMDIIRIVNAGFSLNGGSITGRASANVAGYSDLGVRNAAVTLLGTGYSATPDTDGNFSLQNIPNGDYTLVISAPNMGTVTKNVSVTGTSLHVTTPAMTVSSAASGVKGDVNGDDKLDMEDVIYIMQVLSGVR
jgi:hypothetical protein